ncbi:hypothetical protein GCM10007863_45730 [Dyella mobilis]|uniref:Uncharacterized protein n=2 Tax=Pseudomonadota TaxID=1224 RepID=A0ABQ6DBK3_9HYPH|nr:hypothetical protein GCM10007863_45730 [Dyella mobilis]GLS47051.1 hypothetical protein GCM10007884_50520 [Methylobacterium brachythecii]GLT24645.1 hypothetical protein GCM10007933_41340 [Zoogloea oryzae]
MSYSSESLDLHVKLELRLKGHSKSISIIRISIRQSQHILLGIGRRIKVKRMTRRKDEYSKLFGV